MSRSPQSNINFLVQPAEKDLLEWYAGFHKLTVSQLMRRALAADINSAKRTVSDLHNAGIAFPESLKVFVGEQ